MSYPGYPPSGYPSFPGYPPTGQEYPPANQYSYPAVPGGFPPVGGSEYNVAPPTGEFPGFAGYPTAPGGYPPASSGYPGLPQPGGMPTYPGVIIARRLSFICKVISIFFQVLVSEYLPLALVLAVHSLNPKLTLEVVQSKCQLYFSFEAGYPGGRTPSTPLQSMQGTIQPAPNFDAGRDAEILRKAMKGFGTDEQAIIDVDLIKDLKSELSGNMEELILALFMPRTYYDAWSLRHAMKGAGTQENVLIEILCTRTNREIQEIVQCYKSEFGRDIEHDVRADTSGHFERLLVSMCQIANRDLLSTIGREFSGNVERGLKTILQCALNRPAFFAERLYHAMKGAGTDDSTLIDLVQIKQLFTQMYHKTLATMISSDTGGDYRSLLLAIVGP
ncbi:hypothetical protein Chor_013780 [Crotalus horridus]